MIAEAEPKENAVKIEVEVVEATDEDFNIDVSFEGEELFTQCMHVEDYSITRQVKLGESEDVKKVLDIDYHMDSEKISVTVKETPSGEIVLSNSCLIGKNTQKCFSEEGKSGAVTFAYSLDAASGIVQEVMQFSNVGIKVFSELAFLGVVQNKEALN